MMTLDDAKNLSPWLSESWAWQAYIEWAWRHRKPTNDDEVNALAYGFQAGSSRK